MSSIFEEISKTVVRELDSGGDMIAVRRAIDADRFHCFCLVREKESFFGSRYYKTALTLKDILEREEGERLIDEVDSMSPGQKAEFQILDDVDSKREFTVKLPKAITIEGVAGIQGTQGQEIKTLVNWISQQYLDSFVDRKLKKKLPHIFESIQARRENLYLVTETLVMANEETLRHERQSKFCSWMNWISLSFEHKNQTSVTIPTQWVLGYQIKQLVFPNPERMIKQGLERRRVQAWEAGLGLLASILLTQDLCHYDTRPSVEGRSLSLKNFRNKEKVQDLRSGFQDLTEQEQTDVLSCLTKFCSNDGHLQDLEERVSEVLIYGDLQMEDPAGSLISSLFNAAGILVEACAEAIDLLYALMELSKEYQQLVFEALETGMLPLLVEKVESTLEKKWGEQYSNPHDMDSDSKVSPLAFCVALSILRQLSDKTTSASS
ncbi:LOW QUALITY PROTEIN: gasdermin-B [Dugong dugon]